MTAPPLPGSREPGPRLDATRLWGVDRGPVRLRFLGKQDPPDDARSLLGRLDGAPAELARLRQIHSDRVLDAAAGDCGEGDALVARRAGIAMAIATADCVPLVLLASNPSPGGHALAAVHAGWRGIAAGIALRAVEALGGRVEAAWLGPAIGPCCYEVGNEVAERITRASGAAAAVAAAEGRPHLDLWRALELQLAEAGVAAVHRVGLCTRCHPELLWSYRRDGEAAGRNWLLAWLDG